MAVKALTDFSKYAGKISNSGHDERGRYINGKAGDQTGTEWYIRSWYKRPWNVVIRFEDPKIASMIATLSIYAAQNNKVGYDQGQRTTYWTQLVKAGYDPRKITVACEDDCSAGVMANVRAALELTGHSKWAKNINIHATTWTMRGSICSCGAKVKTFTDASHVNGTSYLLPGDILLRTSAHTAVNLGVGSRMKAPKYTDTIVQKGLYTGTFPTLPKKEYFCKGDTGQQVKYLQSFLRWYGTYYDSIDGSFGNNTLAAVKAFQKAEGLEVDGYFGKKSLAKAKTVKM